jgi:hypothetical protein
LHAPLLTEITVVKQSKPILPFEKGALGGILTLNPPHSPFFKGGGFARGVVVCGNNGGEVEQIHPTLKKKGASSYLRGQVEIILSTPRARLGHQCKARFAGNGRSLAKKRNTAVMAQMRPNVNIILTCPLREQ